MEEDLTTDLLVLQSHLDGMLDRVQHNSLTLKRFQMFEMGLLRLNSLAEMIEHILRDAKTFFDLDVISFCLLDEKGDIAKYLEEDGYDYQNAEGLILLRDKEMLQKTLGMSGRPFLGRYTAQTCADFFPFEQKPSSVAIIPLSRRGNYMGSLNLGSYQSERFNFEMATDFVEHMVSVVSICLENNLNFETMRRTSLVDTLTGVNNRLFLEQRIGEELDRSQRNEQPLSCLFLDIDHFKSVNDNYGHQAGDCVLAEVAGTIKKQLRSNDVLARYGGEEFVALLTNIDESMAGEIAERIRASIKGLDLCFSDHAVSVTISVGSATYQPSKSRMQQTSAEIAERLINSADNALYLAKNNGRDRVERGVLVLDADKLLDSKIA
ncbi:sensor domain-containing diguanylate cyclase [Methylomarinum vadi]|uniref:sensor domain-containing diguanylate cyclase n=1 Tax=Methylomarinum vadi TaxID=438855 RepID=UPI0004DF3616|nr:sensor domain-containing diguanylate cyclase [Methylomarinum vadi]